MDLAPNVRRECPRSKLADSTRDARPSVRIDLISVRIYSRQRALCDLHGTPCCLDFRNESKRLGFAHVHLDPERCERLADPFRLGML